MIGFELMFDFGGVMYFLDGDVVFLFCGSVDLVNGGWVVFFDVVYVGQICCVFVICFKGEVYVYFNCCVYVVMEMDWQFECFFDDSGCWLLCVMYGVIYQFDIGECQGGFCWGGLIKIVLFEYDGVVYWWL